MDFKVGDRVEYTGDDTPTLAKGTEGEVTKSTSLVVDVDFNGRVHRVPPKMLKPSSKSD